MNNRSIISLLTLGAWLLCPAGIAPARAQELSIVTPKDASWLESLAAKEVRRYVYARTGRLVRIVQASADVPVRGDVIVLARRERSLVSSVLHETDERPTNPHKPLAAQQYWLKTVDYLGDRALVAAGGDDLGVLYAAYRLAELMGVRFYLDGDVLPDRPLVLPHRTMEPPKGAELLQRRQGPVDILFHDLDEVRKPLFALRGIQPFHDFQEGPDWWNTDDYLAIISQLPKLGMNFFGLHCYPEGSVGPEPLVWIGQAQDADAQGKVNFSYPSQWASTIREGMWGYQSRKTSAFAFGASQLFAQDEFGPDVMGQWLPHPTTPDAYNAVFNRAAAQTKAAFQQARRLGVKTCMGTETPLTVPKAVADRLKAQGKDPKDLAVIQQLYEGMFQRVANTCDLDYYWFWTPEGWTWDGTKPADIAATTNDLAAAIAARKKVNAPFQLATCGWVLGPQQDRALFDKILPKEMPVSCINRQVGNTPVEEGFASVSGRGKWAIPWLEDDPGLTAPQLWVGRMRRDAADALRYGCDGLMGIHWRTRVLGPAVSALAQAAWEQESWIKSYPPRVPLERTAGPVGGKQARFAFKKIAGTADEPLYQDVRYDLAAYHLSVPKTACDVTLKFCEPNYNEAGKRVFGVKLQDRQVIEHLDILAKVGKDHALDYTFTNIGITNGWLDIEFTREVEFPAVAAIVVTAKDFIRKINCGGPDYKDYEADWPETKIETQTYAASKDFYADWAQAQFGKEIAAPAAALFEKIDCHLPRPADWIGGPGGIRPDNRPWAEVSRQYSFVEELASLRPQVKGAGQRERFDYWLGTFRYLRAMAQVNCTWAVFTNALGVVKAEKDLAQQKSLARDKVLPIRRELVQQTGEVYQHLLATLSNPGELGVLANWEQHLLPDLLDKPGAELAKLLGEPLPEDANPTKLYRGPTRIIVPTQRTSLGTKETFNLKVLILSEKDPASAVFHWRHLGRFGYQKLPLVHVARGVWNVRVPPEAIEGTDWEYYIKVVPEKGKPVYFPPTTPQLNRTVVMMP